MYVVIKNYEMPEEGKELNFPYVFSSISEAIDYVKYEEDNFNAGDMFIIYELGEVGYINTEIKLEYYPTKA